jgi:hypothetical protein
MPAVRELDRPGRRRSESFCVFDEGRDTLRRKRSGSPSARRTRRPGTVGPRPDSENCYFPRPRVSGAMEFGFQKSPTGVVDISDRDFPRASLLGMRRLARAPMRLGNGVDVGSDRAGSVVSTDRFEQRQVLGCKETNLRGGRGSRACPVLLPQRDRRSRNERHQNGGADSHKEPSANPLRPQSFFPTGQPSNGRMARVCPDEELVARVSEVWTFGDSTARVR